MNNVVRDPNIEIGPYRLLRRTDGRVIIFDERIEGPIKTVSDHQTLDDAAKEAKRLVASGSPIAVFDGTSPRHALHVVADDGGDRGLRGGR